MSERRVKPLRIAAVAIGAAIAVTPAVLGLAGNHSLTESVAFSAPAQAGLIPTAEPGDDKGGLRPRGASDDKTARPTASPSAGATSPSGDDKGGLRPRGGSDDTSASPSARPSASDRGKDDTGRRDDSRRSTREAGANHGATREPGDDHGGARERRDDHGRTREAGDDHGSGRHDDSGHHSDDD